MTTIIKIENLWTRGFSMLFGLSVQSSEEFPLVVGCSMQTGRGEIVDVPARFLLSPGFALWGQERADQRFVSPAGAKGIHNIDSWNGRIIFALYMDTTFNTRLADTGWIDWYSINLMGSSLQGLDYQDDAIQHAKNTRYLGRTTEVWTSLEDRSPIDIWKPYLE